MAVRNVKTNQLHLRFIETAKRNSKNLCWADSTGNEMNYRRALVSSLLFCRWLKKNTPGQRMIGILLPASLGGVLTNVAVSMAGKTAVNLNFTIGEEAMCSAIEQCEIQTIITSRIFIQRADLPKLSGMIYLEDLLRSFGLIDKIRAASTAAFPISVLQRLFQIDQADVETPVTVLFSSGSTGLPKGAVFSHENILSNIDSIRQVLKLYPSDCLLGVLPFFHSFGYTVTLWLPLLCGIRSVFHSNPMDAKGVGSLLEKHKATLLISTPTFFRSYARACRSDQFRSLRLAVVGAEKLRPAVAKMVQENLGVELLEGYGCTELGPVVSVNLPQKESRLQDYRGQKQGSVGQPLPGIRAKVLHPETLNPLETGQEGLLAIWSPSRMQEYLNQPELTQKSLQEEWYLTGDIARIDEQGYLYITDRLSRFSKIGGEMVPHLKVENAVNEILCEGYSVVTALPEENKGEQLVVIYSDPSFSSKEIWSRLRDSSLPPLWIPKKENIFFVEKIPVLGTGKVDLKQAHKMAQELISSTTANETRSNRA